MRKNWLERQTWIITGFAYIGAGYVLAFSFSVFVPQTKILLKQMYVKKTIIIGAGADVPIAQASDTSIERTVETTSGEGGVIQVLSVEERIRNEAEKLGFDQIDTLVAIAKCESSLKPECEELNHPACVNPHNKSFDRGYFQISRKWHPEVSDEDAFNLESATRWAIEIQKKSGWEAWACYNLIR